MPEQIDLHRWNRTLLHRQHLIDRIDEDVVEVLDRVVGLQSQDPQAAHFGLWSRIDGYDPVDLDDLLIDREVVRMALLRNTVFLFDGLDARWVRELVQPSIDAAVARTHGKRLRAVTPAELAGHARALLSDAQEPLSVAALRAELDRRWPDEQAEAMVAIVRSSLPLVQTPPRGLWRQGGAPSYVHLDEWIGPGDAAVLGDEARRDLIRMYLRGFGPASAAAIGMWSGLSRLRPLLEEMTADWELNELQAPDGTVLYDLDGLDLVDDEAVPVRLIAPYDNVLLANADRIRIADPDVYRATVTANGRSPGFVLVDGRLAATWRIADGEVELTELVDLQPVQRREVAAEAARLREFAAV